MQAGTVSTFKVNGGALTSMGDVPTGQHPFGVTLDPSGGFLFVVNNVDNTVSAFSVNMTSGMASPVSGSPFSGSMHEPTDIVVVAKQ